MLLVAVSLIIQLTIIYRIITHDGPIECIKNTQIF
jgi:hypothetical protein